MAAPKLRTKLVTCREAREALAIGKTSFCHHWSSVFTDPRAPEDRRPRVARRVYEDELAVAVEAGGGISSRAKAAVINLRADAKRISAPTPRPLRPVPRPEPPATPREETPVPEILRSADITLPFPISLPMSPAVHVVGRGTDGQIVCNLAINATGVTITGPKGGFVRDLNWDQLVALARGS